MACQHPSGNIAAYQRPYAGSRLGFFVPSVAASSVCVPPSIPASKRDQQLAAPSSWLVAYVDVRSAVQSSIVGSAVVVGLVVAEATFGAYRGIFWDGSFWHESRCALLIAPCLPL